MDTLEIPGAPLDSSEPEPELTPEPEILAPVEYEDIEVDTSVEETVEPETEWSEQEVTTDVEVEDEEEFVEFVWEQPPAGPAPPRWILEED